MGGENGMTIHRRIVDREGEWWYEVTKSGNSADLGPLPFD